MAVDLLHFTLILILTTGVALLLHLLRQPPIVAYIVAGILAGPALLGWTLQAEFLEAFSHLGIAFLLFLVGINLDMRSLKQVGMVSLLTGLGQVIFTSAFGYLLSRLLGFGTLESVYIAIALTFSSTIIIVKLLSDKQDLDSLYGRISIGFLVIQDIVAVFVLLVMPMLTEGAAAIGDALISLLLQALLLGGAALLAARYVLPALLHHAGSSVEVLFLFSITLCFGSAILFAALGFSLEIGALVAGLVLASTPYNREIASKVRPLRDFFIILFFIVLGANISLDGIDALLVPAMVLSAFVLIGNPLIVMGLMGLLGYSKRTAFFAGLTVAQISEFSLILVTLGLSLGQVATGAASMVTLVGIITILGSTYMIMHADGLYNRYARHLPYYRRGVHRHEHRKHQGSADAILFGCERIGGSVLEHLQGTKQKVLVVDFNPDNVLRLQEAGVGAIFGDANDVELYNDLPISDAQLVVSTISDAETSRLLLRQVQARNAEARVIVTAPQPEDAVALYEHGADYVIVPHLVGGAHATGMVELLFTDLSGFLEKSKKHQEDLAGR